MFVSILQKTPVLAIERGEGETFVSVPISYDEKTGRIAFVTSTYTYPFEFAAEVYWEFSFAIEVIYEDDSGENFSTQDRYIAANYVPPAIRSRIMPVVCDSLALLTEEIMPGLTYWVTKDRDLPEKAINKYNMLIHRMQDLGYICREDGTDKIGRRYWTMHRNAR